MGVEAGIERVLAENFIFPVNDVLDIARQFFVCFAKIRGVVNLLKRHIN